MAPWYQAPRLKTLVSIRGAAEDPAGGSDGSAQNITLRGKFQCTVLACVVAAVSFLQRRSDVGCCVAILERIAAN